jgi:type VI secretion system secreted protein VgrG
MADLSQGTRIAAFQSALGNDKLVISRFEAFEGLSELFDYHCDVLSEDSNIDFDKILGTNCSLAILSNHENVKRYFNGVLVEAQWLGTDHAKLAGYRLILRPWFWLLQRTTNCRIFSEKTVPDIIKEVFGKHGFAKFEPRLTANYPVLEYCVQYRESDYSFVSRLMEEFGIYYFFDHSESEHKMILADSLSAHKPKAAGASLSFYASENQALFKEDGLNEWSVGRSFRSGNVTLNDYDYKKPTADLLAEKQGNAKYANGQLQVYDYPGRYIEKSNGFSLANIRLEGEQAQDKRSVGTGDAVTNCPGHLMQLAKHPQGDLNKEYLIVRAQHVFRSNAYRSTSSGGGENYAGRYDYQPSTVPFRAPALTEKPLIYGPQTAVVSSEVDDQCRIKVNFHWDRDKKDSRYVRIGHAWSGSNWGHIMIPRIGMEVIVEFLEGDPDQPLITGTVYNHDNPPPYTLPEDKSISGVKSKTIDGSGYNEFIMDDRQNDELIRLHAERDMESKIENDERKDVGKKLEEKIGDTWTVKVTNKIQFTVGASTLTMDKQSITLCSPKIDLQALVDLNMMGVGTAKLQSGGTVSIMGPLVLIN